MAGELRLLGKGSGSALWAYGVGEHCVVMKVVPRQRVREGRHLRNQWAMLRQLEHEHIVRALKYQENVTFSGTTVDKQTQSTHNILVLEYASKGSLLNHLPNINSQPHTLRTLYKQILQAVAHLHSLDIAHRDLKLDNVLVFEQEGSLLVKVSDFGFASTTTTTYNEYKGTPKGYMAPEIHYCLQNKDKPYNAEKTDIFALGVILFAILMGKLPFETANQSNRLYQLIKQQRYEEFWAFHSKASLLQLQSDYRIPQFKQLFIRMVDDDPKMRPSCGQVLQEAWLA